MLRLILASFIVFLALVAGGRNAGMTSGIATYSIQQPVEQQTPGGAKQPDPSLWIINPFTACAWDADDHGTVWGTGKLAPGETFTSTLCLVTDTYGHLWGLVGAAEAGAKFTVSIAVPEIGFSAVSNPSANIDQHNSEARICALGPRYDSTSPDLLPIAGSNGGVGKLLTLTQSMTNTGTKTIRRPSLGAYLRVNSDFYTQDFCPGGDSVWPLSIYGTPWGSYPGPIIWWVK